MGMTAAKDNWEKRGEVRHDAEDVSKDRKNLAAFIALTA